MKKKTGLFSKVRKESDEAPWSIVLNALTFLAPGDKITIPSTRSTYELLQEEMRQRADDQAKEILEFIEFVLKHEKLGNFEFEPEA